MASGYAHDSANCPAQGHTIKGQTAVQPGPPFWGPADLYTGNEQARMETTKPAITPTRVRALAVCEPKPRPRAIVGMK